MGANPSREFCYEPLASSSHIRLIECVPEASESTSSTIVRWFHFITTLGGWLKILDETVTTNFQLQDFKLDECPPYFAISYAWGSPDRIRNVQVSNRRFPVTKSLNYVLRDVSGFMLNVDNSGVKHFWVDGICINQGDLTEKNAQVKLMTEIYRKATSVITYTGPKNNDTRPAILLAFRCQAFLQAWDHAIHNAEDPDEVVGSIYSIITSGNGLDKLGFPPANDPQYRSLCRLLGMPWSSRAWIVQESAMNRNNMMMCGEATLQDWDILGDVVDAAIKDLLPKQCILSPEDQRKVNGVSGPDYIHMLWGFRKVQRLDGCFDKTLLRPRLGGSHARCLWHLAWHLASDGSIGLLCWLL
jgi:hypothetical protein